MKTLVLSTALLISALATTSLVGSALAEGNAPDAAASSQRMKGPPNADGMKSGEGDTKMQAGRSESGTSTPSGNADKK